MLTISEIKNKSKRVTVFDELRGFMLINVILYHLFYDLTDLFQIVMPWFYSPAAYLWQEIVSCTLIFISGACSYYSKNNIKRGIRILSFACMLTLITYIAVPEIIVTFGILHLLGTSMILFVFVKPITSKLPVHIGIIISFVLFIFTSNLTKGYLNFGSFVQIQLPSVLYSTDYLFAFGFHSPKFMSSDYFPLFPYFFMFLSGSYLGCLGHNDYFPDFMYNNHIKLLSYMGKNSLWIYLLHQPIIYSILLVIFKFG